MSDVCHTLVEQHTHMCIPIYHNLSNPVGYCMFLGNTPEIVSYINVYVKHASPVAIWFFHTTSNVSALVVIFYIDLSLFTD